MSGSVFSDAALANVVRAGDSRRFGVDLKNDRSAIISAASVSALAGLTSLNEYHTTQLRGRTYVSYGDYERALVIRAVSRHLRRRLRIRMPDRHRAVNGVITSLLDATPMSVIRCDIASFYETIPIEPLRDQLLYDTASSTLVRSYIREFFLSHCGSARCGLPRGAGLSAILSEIALRQFDEGARLLTGVYRYFRYADDIILFVTGEPEKIFTDLSVLLPRSMKFNKTKSAIIDLTNDEKDLSVGSRQLDFLGYRFSIEDLSGQGRNRRLEVTISDKKITKLKSKIILSLRDYCKSVDGDLLLDRIRFLSSNYNIKRSGHSHVRSSEFIKSGIYFNYKMSGTYKIGKDLCLTKSTYAAVELKKLDGFFRSLINSRNSEFRTPVRNGLNNAQQAELNSLSFVKGYSEKMIMRVNPERISDIKRVWRNV